jgi:hypothetical protein
MVPADTSASTHWHGLLDAGNEAAFGSAWLALQCSRLPGVVAGLLLIPQVDASARRLSATWPAGDLDVGDLSQLAERAHAEHRIVVASGRVGRDASPARPVVHIVALPLGTATKPVAAAAFALTTTAGRPVATPQYVAEQLRWGAGWLEALPWARRSKDLSSDVARAASCLDLLAAVGAQPRLQGMAITIVNELATRLRCDRVSIGVVARNGTVRLRAVSHSASFKRASRLVDGIENAMDEATSNAGAACRRPHGTLAHRALSESAAPALNAGPLWLTVGRTGRCTHLRTPPPSPYRVLHSAEAIAALLGPQSVAAAGEQVWAHQIAWLTGMKRWSARGVPGLKLATAGVVGLALALILRKASTALPQRQYLKLNRSARPSRHSTDHSTALGRRRRGDGDLLVALDDRDLFRSLGAPSATSCQRQREAWPGTRRNNLVVQPRSGRPKRNWRWRTRSLHAPASSLPRWDRVSGDLAGRSAHRWKRGRRCSRLPCLIYRLIVQVDERDVRYIAVGPGTVALSGAWHLLPMSRSKITPVTVAEGWDATPSVEARLTETVCGDGRRRQGRSRRRLIMGSDAPSIAAPCCVEVPAFSRHDRRTVSSSSW